jgi:type II secretory pathway predicted ATPase ExeA
MSEFLRFWQVQESIFLRELPDGELFRSRSLSLAIPRSLHFCREHYSSVILTVGDSGVGKTCFLRWLISSLSAETHDILYVPVLSREIHRGWLIQRIARYLGVKSEGPIKMLDLLGEAAAKLDQLVQEKRHLLVLVDNAHLVDPGEALTDISACLNLQSLGSKCLSFVLAGHRPLEASLRDHPGILSKTVLRVELIPFEPEETAAFLHFRFQLAGRSNAFDLASAQAVHRLSAGIPSWINILAENCLFEAFQIGQKSVDITVVERAARLISLQLPNLHPDDGAGQGEDRNGFGKVSNQGQLIQGSNVPFPEPPSHPKSHSQTLPPRPPSASEVSTAKPHEKPDETPILLTSLFKSDLKPSKS